MTTGVPVVCGHQTLCTVQCCAPAYPRSCETTQSGPQARVSPSGRRCTDQLLQAAAAAANGGGAQPQDACAVAALRCSRCMALMLQVVKQGQVRGCHDWTMQRRSVPLSCHDCDAYLLQALWIMQLLFVTACGLLQGNTMPSVPAHGASFRGAPVDFEVVVMPQNRRFRVASHQNAYIGALRRQVSFLPTYVV